MKSFVIPMILINIAWVVLVLVILFIHTDVILAGKSTQEQDDQISEAYGQFIFYSSLALWVVALTIRNKKTNKVSSRSGIF